MKIQLGALTFAILALEGAASAATVNYDEALQGDITPGVQFSQLTNLGLFDVGTNSVSGNVGTIIPGSTVFDADQFLFQIPDKMVLSSVTLSFANVSGLSTFTTKIWEILDIPNNTTGTQAHEVLTFSSGFTNPISLSPVSAFQSYMPAGAGLYSVGIPTSFGSTGDHNLDYVWQFEVVAVPLPAALPLLASALAGIGLIGWRRKKRIGAA